MAVAVNNRHLSTDWYAGTRKRQLIALTGLVVVLSLALVRLVLSFDLAAVAGLFVWFAVVAIVVQPRYGVYLTFALILFFEAGGYDPIMAPGFYINSSPQATLHLNGVILTPIEMLVLLTVCAWLAQGVVRQRLDFQAGAFGMPVLLFSVMLLWGIVRGLMAGAVFNITFWECRFLLAMVLCYILAANTIRSSRHIRTLLTIVFVAVSLNGIEGVWRKYALIDAGVLGKAPEYWYSHEDVIIWGLLIMLVLAQQVFGGPRSQRLLGPILIVFTIVTMLLSERRAGYVAVMLAFLVFGFILFRAKRKAFWLLVVPITIAGAVYLPVFWNNTGTLGQPARAIRSISDPDPRDASSNAWRDLEAINVRATIQADPLLGIGFGRPFLQIVQVPAVAFEFWDLEAHHDILWVWMKTGAVGFIAFFWLMCSGVARSAFLARTLKSPEYRTFAILTVCTIAMSLVFSYVDLGLVTSRVPMLLGIMLGGASVLHRIHQQEQPAQAQ